MSDFDKNELKARVKHLTAKDPGSHAFVKATDVWLPPSECPEQTVRSLPLVCQLIRLPLRPGSRGVGGCQGCICVALTHPPGLKCHVRGLLLSWGCSSLGSAD